MYFKTNLVKSEYESCNIQSPIEAPLTVCFSISQKIQVYWHGDSISSLKFVYIVDRLQLNFNTQNATQLYFNGNQMN